MTQMRAKTAWPPLRTTIDTGRSRVVDTIMWLLFLVYKNTSINNESFNIHKCTFTSRKSLNICTWSSAPYTVTEKLLYIIKGLMKVISGLLPETLGYFCMKNFISTTWNCHSYIHESTHFILFALLKVHRILNDSNEGQDCLASSKNNHWHWQIEGCRYNNVTIVFSL
jgi:hypothetical protein